MDRCDAILKDGVFDQILVNTSKSLSGNLTEWLESIDYEEFQKQQSAGLNIGFPIKGIPVSIGGTFSQNEFENWKKEVSSGSSRQFREDEVMQIFNKSASQTILKAWSDCISQTASATGLQYDTEVTNGGLDIVFTVRWVPNSMADFPPVVIAGGFQVSGATPKSLFPDGMEIPLAGFSVLMSRNDTSGVKIILNTTKGRADGDVPPLPPLVPVLPKIQLELFKATGNSASHPNVTLTVPSDYKILGGGARVNWSGDGNLLTASFPKDAQTWVAKAKDHSFASPATIDAWAIAIYDPTDLWEVDIFSTTSDSASHPLATANISNSFVLTGGGAAANWSGNGSLLTASYPEGTVGWTAKSKDHVVSESVSITAYAIGIRARNGASGPSVKIFTNTSSPAQHPSTEVSTNSGYSLVGGGAQVNWRGNGNLLTASFPEGNQWKVASKDHSVAESCTITAYAIGIRP